MATNRERLGHFILDRYHTRCELWERQLRCDRYRVDVLVEAAGAVETGIERTRTGTAGFRIAGDIRAVIVARGVGGPNRVPLVCPHCTDRVPLGGNGDVVTEAPHQADPELLIVEVRRRVVHLDARPPSLTAVSGLGVADVQARGRLPAGAVARWPGGGVVRISSRVVPDSI